MQRYGKQAFEAIISRHGCLELVDVREDGVWPSEACRVGDPTQRLLWVPACELEGPDAPDPLVAPGLPIPFTASELAAFTLDGIGTMVTELYGSTADGPYEEMLDALGPRGTKPKEAVRAAYAALREAEAVHGHFDEQLRTDAQRLADDAEEKNLEANDKEGLWEAGISEEEKRQRRDRASTSAAEWFERHEQAESRYHRAFARWRKEMAMHLLQKPQDQALDALPVAPLEAPASGPAWQLLRAERFQGYRKPLYDLLKAASSTGKPLPTAYDVFDAWKANPPAGILGIADDELKFEDKNGNPQTATRDAIRKAIGRLTRR